MSKKVDFVKTLNGMNEAELTAKIKEDEMRIKKLTFAHSLNPSLFEKRYRSFKNSIKKNSNWSLIQ